MKFLTNLKIVSDCDFSKNVKQCKNCRSWLPINERFCPFCNKKESIISLSINKLRYKRYKKDVLEDVFGFDNKKCPECENMVPTNFFICPYCKYQFEQIEIKTMSENVHVDMNGHGIKIPDKL